MESKGFNSQDYAIEELTAEMGASYLKSHVGIPIWQLDNNASYIQSWLERLKNDKRFIVHASSQAQKATDYILGIQGEEKEMDSAELSVEQDNSVDREGELRKTREKKEPMSIEPNR